MDPTLQSLAPTAVENLYHVAYVVPDLLAAMESMGRRLQITWATPFQMSTGFTTAGGATDDHVTRFAMSTQGPPHVELIEAVADPASIFAQPSAGRWAARSPTGTTVVEIGGKSRVPMLRKER